MRVLRIHYLAFFGDHILLKSTLVSIVGTLELVMFEKPDPLER